MRCVVLVALVLGACGAPAAGSDALTLGRVARGDTRRSSHSHAPPCAGDRGAPDTRYTFTAPRDGHYRVRAEGWFELALTARDATGGVLGCAVTREGTAAEIPLDLRAGEEIVVHVDGVQAGRGDHRVSVREVVPLQAAVVLPAPPSREHLSVLGTSITPLAVGDNVVELTTSGPFTGSCGAFAASGGRSFSLDLDRTSALELRARSDHAVLVELHREGESPAILACEHGSPREHASVRRRLPVGRYVVVIATGPGEPGERSADVSLETTLTPLDDGADPVDHR